MKKELEELVSDFIEALDILENYQDSFDKSDKLSVEELVFRHKWRTANNILSEIKDLPEALERSQDDLEAHQDILASLKEKVQEVLNEF